MTSLTQALNLNQAAPAVADILANIESAKNGGDFSMVTTKDKKEYYFLTTSAADIEANPDAFIARHSGKHDAMFIVPLRGSSSFDKSNFKA